MIPFDLTNALAIFQALMNHIFKEYLSKFVLVFFDNILVYSMNEQEHFTHLKKVLMLLLENKLHAKESKYSFFQ